MAAKLTPGQQSYIDDLKKSPTTVAVTGKVTKTEIIDSSEDDPRSFMVRATVTADDGQTVTYDFYPPLSADEQAAEAARVAKAEEERAALLEIERQKMVQAVEGS